MEVIPLVKFVLKMVGALPSLKHIPIYRIYGFTILIMMTLNLYAYILAFIGNWGNAMLFCQTLSMSMGAFSAVVKSSTLIFSQNTFKSILDGIQRILDIRAKEDGFKQYQKYNKIERNYSHLYGLFMLMSAQTICIGPLITTLYGFYNGKPQFRYPCEVVYLLRKESLSEFIAFFAYSALNIQFNAAFLFASEASFFCVNLYLIAALDDLMDNFKEIEKIKKTRPNDELVIARNQKKQLVQCIYFHRKILWLANQVQDVFSPIIFFQFFMSALQICAITLELLLHEHITMDRFIQVFPVYPTILAILFIYCYFGNELSVKAYEVSMAVYNSEWYYYPLEMQKLTPTIICRAQKPVIISGFQWFSCTLENYTKALNKVTSLLTIMRQLLNK